MPLIDSTYKPPHLFRNGHISTIYSAVFRKVNDIHQERERMNTSDGDFIDLDWSYCSNNTSNLVIILHGLEGNAQRPYIKGSAKFFNQNGFDACAVNFRGCSGEPNKLYTSYHSGISEDLEEVIAHITKQRDYDNIVIKGFSLGANVLLKYLGQHKNIPLVIKAGIAVSVPCLLKGSMLEIHKFKNILYSKRFKRNLLGKLRIKLAQFPDRINETDLKKVISLKDFDDIYTSRAHGFEDAFDYYEKSSSLQFLRNIKIPTLIINARNDSFLSDDCFPIQCAKENNCLHLEIPEFGGHVGFYEKGNIYYNEKRSLEFAEKYISKT